MRTLLKAGLVIILSSAIIGAPAMAAPATPASAPLGVVLQADRAQVGADITASGATIYDGDRLETTADGALRAKLGGPQMFLRPNTIALVHNLSNGFSADLTAGTIVVSSGKGENFQVFADGATIRPTGADPVIAQVTRINANQLVLTSTRGTFEVAMGSEVRTVEAGHSYRLEADTTEDSSGPGPQGGPYHTARNRFIWIAIIGISAGTAVGVWRALVSPSGL